MLLRSSTLLAAATIATAVVTGCGAGEPGSPPEPAPAMTLPSSAQTPTTQQPSTDPTADEATVSATATATATEASAEEVPADAVETDEVAAVDFAFAPASIVVPAGTTVTFSNEDSARHTVTAGTPTAPEPEAFDLELPGAASTVAFTFDEPGTYAYFCEPHPFMRARVTVTG
jgi:plastocyanin